MPAVIFNTVGVGVDLLPEGCWHAVYFNLAGFNFPLGCAAGHYPVVGKEFLNPYFFHKSSGVE